MIFGPAEWWMIPVEVHYPPRPWLPLDRLRANARLAKLMAELPMETTE